MKGLHKKYTNAEIKALKELLNSDKGKAYVEALFDNYNIDIPKNNDVLTEEVQERMLNNIHVRIHIEELIQSIKKDHSSSFASDRLSIPRQPGHRLKRYLLYALSLLVVLFSVWMAIDVQKNELSQEIIAPRLNVKATSSGQKLTLRLSDGTKVILNANSEITYPENFGDSIRQVNVTGEAYFEVAHNSEKPFLVDFGSLQSKVLGTCFSVKHLLGKNINQIALVSGKVSVHQTDIHATQNEVMLLPGEKAVLQAGEIHKKTFDHDTEVGWKDNIIVFKDADFEEVVETLENWYGVTFHYDNSKHRHSWHFTAKFEDMSLEKLLHIISESEDIQFTIYENNVDIKFKPM